MSQTVYNRNLAVAVPGLMSQDDDAFIVSYPAAGDIPPGRMVVLTSSGTVKLPDEASFAKPVGFSVYSPTNMMPAVPAAGFVYKAGDMVPCLRRGRCYVEYDGGVPATLTEANVKHSTTIATHRGKITASATSTGVGTEISDPGPVMFVESGPSGVWLAEVAFPGQSIDADARLDALEADAATANATINIPLMCGLDSVTGALMTVFADGVSTTPGTQFTNSKTAAVRWNNDAAPGAIAVNVAMPGDLDDAANVVFHALVSKTGATAGDATKLTVGAFEIVPGSLHDVDVDFGGDTNALTGAAAAKTVTELTLTLALADVHAYPEGMCLTIKPKAGTLGTDDLVLHAAWLSYTRKIQTS